MLTREWLAVLMFVGLVFSLIVISRLSRVEAASQLAVCSGVAERKVSITLTGAVVEPGRYQVLPGTTLRDLLRQAPLSKRADRKKIPFKKVFYASQELHIPEKQEPCNPDKNISLLEK